MIKSSNPALGDKTFENLQPAIAAEGRMTINGTINKTLILLVLALVPAAWVWDKFYKGGAEAVGNWIMIAVIAGLVVAMATIFKKTWAPFTAPLYAVIEGVVIGGISAIAEAQFQGIVFQAAALTFGTLLALLVAYRTGVIKVTERFRLGVVAATGGIFVVYLVSIVLGFFGVNVPFIHSGGPIGILFSLFVVVIAALNLVLDFDFIERGSAEGAPKYMEWYGAFGLIVTLIWLYIEFLRLLTKLRQ
ncbi:MAG TPA: Bax inhibitor-1/YccA family protein [Thermodesulfobacteriota bacterium]|nr:Bax inhibitor-1/YccA family protein [Thermodesulfobacteriota bacterium]